MVKRWQWLPLFEKGETRFIKHLKILSAIGVVKNLFFQRVGIGKRDEMFADRR